jgi:predicted nucleic acid-binding protein
MYRRKPFARSYFQLARDWLATLDMSLRSLDCLHLATASFEDLELVTADRGLARAAEIVGVECRLLASRPK